MRRRSVVALALLAASACDRVLKLDDVKVYLDAPGTSGGGDGGHVDGPPLPAACTPGSFGSAADTMLFNGTAVTALTVSLDSLTYLVEIKPTSGINELHRMDADATTDQLIAPPKAGDAMTEPTIDPEADVLYARDKTALDTIVAYALTSNTYQPSPTLQVPSGHRPGNQTLDLGDGTRRMMVQYDPGTGVYEFYEYVGSPAAGWTVAGHYIATDLLGAAANLADPSLDANGLNLVFVANGDVYFAHRIDVGKKFANASLIRTGSFSTPVLASSCRTLYVIDKTTAKAHRLTVP